MHVSTGHSIQKGGGGDLLGMLANLGGSAAGKKSGGFGSLLSQLLGSGSDSGSATAAASDLQDSLAAKGQALLDSAGTWLEAQVAELQTKHGDELGPLLEKLGSKLDDLLASDNGAQLPPELAAFLTQLAQQLAPSTTTATEEATTDVTSATDVTSTAGAAVGGESSATGAAVEATPLAADTETTATDAAMQKLAQRMAQVLQQAMQRTAGQASAAETTATQTAAVATEPVAAQAHVWNLKELTVALRKALEESGIGQRVLESETGASVEQAETKIKPVGTLESLLASSDESVSSQTTSTESGTLNHLTARLLQSARAGDRGQQADAMAEAMPAQPSTANVAALTSGAAAVGEKNGKAVAAEVLSAWAPSAEEPAKTKSTLTASAADGALQTAATPVAAPAQHASASGGSSAAHSVDRAAVVQQVQDLSAQMLSGSAGTIRTDASGVAANLKLNPVELGEVRVALTMQQDGSLQAQFSASQPETAALIAQHSQQLSDALTRSGAGFERVQVLVPGATQTQSAQAGGQGNSDRGGFSREQTWTQAREGNSGNQRQQQRQQRQAFEE